MFGQLQRMPLRLAVAAAVAALSLVTAAPALGQSSPDQPRRTRGDGGLDVSGGCVVGYVGGSGSISGNVRGPGGSGGSGTAPERVSDPAPSVLDGGVVSESRIPVPARARPDLDETRKASALWPGVLAPVLMSLIAASGVVLFFRRRPRLS